MFSNKPGSETMPPPTTHKRLSILRLLLLLVATLSVAMSSTTTRPFLNHTSPAVMSLRFQPMSLARCWASCTHSLPALNPYSIWSDEVGKPISAQPATNTPSHSHRLWPFFLFTVTGCCSVAAARFRNSSAFTSVMVSSLCYRQRRRARHEHYDQSRGVGSVVTR